MFGFDFRDLLEEIIDGGGDTTKSSAIHYILRTNYYHKENVTILEGNYDRKAYKFTYSKEVQARFFHSSDQMGGAKETLTLFWIGEDEQVTGIRINEEDIKRKSKKPIPHGEKDAVWIEGKYKDWFILRDEKVKKTLLQDMKGIVDVFRFTEEKENPTIAAIKSQLNNDLFYIDVRSIKCETYDGKELFNEETFGKEVIFENGILLIAWINKITEEVRGIWFQEKDIARLDEEISKGKNTYQIFTHNEIYTFVKSDNPKKKR
jgi:hypothetical protein